MKEQGLGGAYVWILSAKNAFGSPGPKNVLSEQPKQLKLHMSRLMAAG